MKNIAKIKVTRYVYIYANHSALNAKVSRLTGIPVENTYRGRILGLNIPITSEYIRTYNKLFSCIRTYMYVHTHKLGTNACMFLCIT